MTRPATDIVFHTTRAFAALMMVLCVLICTHPAHAKNALSVGAYDNFPKVYQDENGDWAGIFPELLNLIAAEHGWELDYVPGTWTECLARLESAELSIMVDVAFSKQRAQKYLFNRETVFINWGVVYAKGGHELNSLVNLKDKTIAVMRGSIHTTGREGIKNLLKKFSIPVEFIEVDSYEEVLSLVDAGRADAGVVNRLYGLEFAPNYNVHPTPIIFNPRDIKFAFPKNEQSEALARNIDAWLMAQKKQKNSPYHAVLDTYLAGRPRERGGRRPEAETVKRVHLTDKEQAWILEHPRIRTGCDPEFAPFEFYGQGKVYSGLASDYVKLINKRTGLNMQVVPGIDWAGSIAGIKAGSVDVLPCVGETETRKEFLHYTRPYLKFQRVIITRADAPFITGLADLEDKTIAVQANSAHDGFLRENTSLNSQNIIPFPTLKAALKAVSDGRAQALVGNLASCAFWIRNLSLTNLKIAAPVTHESDSLFFAVRKDWPELAHIINKALATVTAEEHQAIMQRWIGVEFKTGYEPSVIWSWAARIGGALLLFVALILYWTYRLKREVKERKRMAESLKYRSELERLVMEISSTLITLQPDELDEHMPKALQRITRFIGADAGYIYRIGPNDTLEQEFIWSAGGAVVGLPDSECSPWRTERILGNNLAVYPLPEGVSGLEAPPAVCTPGENTPSQAPGDTCSFLDVPRAYGGHVMGLLGLCTKTPDKKWRSDEVKLLQLMGQILTNAMMRKKAELALTQYASQLTEANQRLQELDHLKSMFIASMSHELRTPLNSIIGFTGVILQGMSGELNEVQKDQLRRVYGSAKHLLELITDVIDISKIEAGRIDVFPREFMLHDVVEEAKTVVNDLYTKRGLPLMVEIPDDVALHTDHKRLLQCLINVLSNAGKYTETGCVTLRARIHDTWLDLEVEDTGIGISRQDLDQLFEPFERLETHLKVKAGGTGLGLYLTKKIITDLLGGKISVTSAVGKGSVFTLTLPMRIDAWPSDGETRP